MSHLILVDDNEESLVYLAAQLRALGHRVEIASDGRIALDRARQEAPDVIISDILMPVMDGFALCREWMLDDHLCAIPFVFYTATYTDARDEQLARSLGAAAFILKPAPADRFRDLLAQPLAAGTRSVNQTDGESNELSDPTYLRQYNQALIRKLEDKLDQLAAANTTLATSERELAAKQQRLDLAILGGDLGVWDWDVVADRFEVNDRYGAILGHEPRSLTLDRAGRAARIHPGDDAPADLATLLDGAAGRYDREFRMRTASGRWRWVHERGQVVSRDPGGGALRVSGTLLDIDDRKTAELERAELEGRLRQAQRLHAVGRLAGGVAHDFNNLLLVILGYTEMALQRLPAGDRMAADLRQVLDAAGRAKNLTWQLLAFSRKQPLDLRVILLNDVVIGLGGMLRRLVREDIQIRVVLEPTPIAVRADRTQLEQILLNLATNAVDAMPDGGSLAIETSVIEADDDYARQNPEVTAGRYACLVVTDTGHGIDRETQELVFEPFFTTKVIGKGTGLGLATVHGIVSQHGGSIQLHSEPGRGTAFRVLLPAIDASPVGTIEAVSEPPGGAETVLVAEDMTSVRGIVCEVLRGAGYHVLEGESVEQALAVAAAHAERIDLLLTDVVLTDGNGKELHTRLSPLRPAMKVVFMSGYTNDVIAHRGVLEPATHFLQKPFSAQTLRAKVRQALDSDSAS